jgi:hypothetical protein
MEPHTGQVPKVPSAPGVFRSTWGLVVQFIAAVLVVAVLVAGPDLWEAGGRLKDYLQGAEPIGPLRVSPPVKMPSKPTAAPVVLAPVAAATSAPPASVSPPVIKVTAPPAPPVQPAARPTPLLSLRDTGVKHAPTPRPAATPAAKWHPTSEMSILAAAPPGMTPQQYFESLMRQGLQLYQSGWYGPAFGRFKQASVVMPLSPNPLVWEARAAMQVGRYAEARQALERAIALAPASPAAREARALLETFK